MKKKTSKRTDNMIIRRYKKGTSAAEIAGELTLSIATVYNTLRDNDVSRRSRGRPKGSFNASGARKIPFEDIPSVIKRYLKDKESITSIAKDYGVSRQAIDSLLKTRSVHRDKIPFRKIQLADFPKVVKKFHAYKNISKVARDFNVSPVAIVNVLKKEGVKHDQYVHHLDLTEEQIDLIIARYTNGDFAKDIAKDFELQPYSVWSILNQRGVRRGGHWPKKFSLSRYPEFKKAHNSGLTLEEMATKFDLSVGGVSLILKRIEENAEVC